MSLTVAERARRIATFRFVEVRLMEIGGLDPTTPEMEVKVLLGRHIWDFAQHADALGKRTLELRERLHHSRPPTSAAYQRLPGRRPRLRTPPSAWPRSTTRSCPAGPRARGLPTSRPDPGRALVRGGGPHPV
jgi:hypothetical protein